ncbi:MAG: MoxR family ATPase, partial [Planctomycetes bacterium]|nr:MoxR family ATPase [Planctomycetota bacterium]
MEPSTKPIEAEVEAFATALATLRSEVGKAVVGQHDVVEQVLVALFSGGHVLLEGVPGLGKTLIVRTVSQALDLPFSRIQFTPDL